MRFILFLIFTLLVFGVFIDDESPPLLSYDELHIVGEDYVPFPTLSLADVVQLAGVETTESQLPEEDTGDVYEPISAILGYFSMTTASPVLVGSAGGKPYRTGWLDGSEANVILNTLLVGTAGGEPY